MMKPVPLSLCVLSLLVGATGCPKEVTDSAEVSAQAHGDHVHLHDAGVSEDDLDSLAHAGAHAPTPHDDDGVDPEGHTGDHATAGAPADDMMAGDHAADHDDAHVEPNVDSIEQALENCVPASREPIICGNGAHEIGEECDDGNTRSGDGCSQTCVDEAPSRNLFQSGHPGFKYLSKVKQNPAFSDTNEHGTFRIKIDPSHYSYNDPIVYPCEPDRAHLHTFFGNKDVTAATVDAKAMFAGKASTSQGGPLNKTAYWMPTMLRPVYQKDASGNFRRDGAGRPIREVDENGKPAVAIVYPLSNWKLGPDGAPLRDGSGNLIGTGNWGTGVYYKRATQGRVHPFPTGLRMISGNAAAQGPQSKGLVRFHCPATQKISSQDDFFSHIPSCRPSGTMPRVHLSLFFPMCWDGKNLDADNHNSHMSGPIKNPNGSGSVCPSSHPVALPRVSFEFDFPVTSENVGPTGDTSEWFLASDSYDRSTGKPGGYSAHGDWFMAWDAQVMTTWVQRCINEERHCSNGDLGNGYRMRYQEPGVGNVPAIAIPNDGMPLHHPAH